RDPQTIAVDISHTHAFSDGLTAGEWEELEAVLPERYRSRIVHAESLPLEYQEIRAPAMLPAYRRLMQVVWGTIDTAFSNRVITPGKTTTDDVAWWMRQRVNDLGFGTWFHTDVDVQRRGVDLSDSGAVVIQRGDVLHCDFGITALGLNTDTQHVAHVLRVGVQAQCGDSEVAVQHVAALNHDGAGIRQIDASPLHVHVGVEPGAEPEVVHPLAHPPGDVVGRRLARRDDPVRERGIDGSPDDLHQPPVGREHRRSADLLILERQALGVHDAGPVSLGKHGLELLPLARRQPVREGVRVRDVDGNGLRVALLDHLAQQIPLCLSHQLGAPTDRRIDRLARMIGFVQAAL